MKTNELFMDHWKKVEYLYISLCVIMPKYKQKKIIFKYKQTIFSKFCFPKAILKINFGQKLWPNFCPKSKIEKGFEK